jgi:uncharacterized Zn finger protein
MKRILFRHRCGELGIDYDIDIETQRAVINKPQVECDDCGKLTSQSHKVYSRITYGTTRPYWLKKCLECGEKTAIRNKKNK